MEPMRPVEVTEVPVDPRARRKDIWWRITFCVMFVVQVVLVIESGLSYWWAAGISVVVVVLFEGTFWVLDRRRS
ncbi:MAG: hypothetical protein ACSLE8_07360 [Rhodococcus sp. (in: high G+C Gram-positive bacteria)]